MVKPKITQEILKELSIVDISIRDEYGLDFLILISETKEMATMVHKFLKKHFRALLISINQETENYILTIEFKNSDFNLVFQTDRNEESYPPLTKLKNSKINALTTGLWGEISEKGKMVYFNRDLIRFGHLDIGKALGLAHSIQFLVPENSDSPTIISLLYSSEDHIQFVEAYKAFETLKSMSSVNPKLELNLKQKNKISLRFWDVIVDLDICVSDLNYDHIQLENFLKKVDTKDSFQLCLGFIDKGNVVFVSQTDSIESIKLNGYVIKK